MKKEKTWYTHGVMFYTIGQRKGLGLGVSIMGKMADGMLLIKI